MGEHEIELAIYTSDITVAESIIQQINDVEIRRPRVARTIDPMTVISMVSTSVALVEGLLDLRDRIREHKSAPKIVVRNERGESVSLADAGKEDPRAPC